MKGLEALEEIVDYAIGHFTNNEAKYKQDLDIIEKELKALKIIKEKRVDAYKLLDSFREGGLEKYNNYMDILYLPEYYLTQEEYGLLREVLL